jgi:hypothetical protein
MLFDIPQVAFIGHNEFDGIAGVTALQLVSQAIVPVVILVIPQTFATEVFVQLLPNVGGFAGIAASQRPLQPMLPRFVSSHEFGAD